MRKGVAALVPDAVETLYSQISALPDPDFGRIDLLPFAQDTDQVKAIKRRVCEAIVRVLDDGGFLATSEAGPAVQRVSIQCRNCQGILLSTNVDKFGAAAVPGDHTIRSLAQMNPECPHQPLTLDDQRRKIEEALGDCWFGPG